MLRIILASLAFLIVLGNVYGQSTLPEDSEIIRAIFPWCKSLVLEQNFKVCTGDKYKVCLSGGPVKATLLKKTDDAEYFVAAIAFGQGEDLEHYYWYNQVLLAVLCRKAGTLKLIHKTKLPNEGEYMHRVEDVKPLVLNNQPVALLQYRYSDSVSTPRGWHTISKIFSLTDQFTTKELWSFETGFVRPAAASLPSVEKIVDFHFVDFDGDGDDDIVTSASIKKSNLWTKYSWKDGGLIKTESNE